MKTIPIIRQNIDRNVKASEYDQFPGQLLVTSIFRTIQGEAPFIGYPAVFLRLSGCNFGSKTEVGACQWCDTSFQFDKGRAVNLDSLLEEVKALAQPGDVLVITGGEPTLQSNLVEFMAMVLARRTLFSTIQIETNGTQPAFYTKLKQVNLPVVANTDSRGVYVVVSPKGVYKAGVIPKPSDTVLLEAGCLKFVIETDPDSPHHQVPEWAVQASSALHIPIYVSPMTVYRKAYAGEVSSIWDNDLIDQEATAANYAYVARYAIENNFRVSVQMHTFLAVA